MPDVAAAGEATGLDEVVLLGLFVRPQPCHVLFTGAAG